MKAVPEVQRCSASENGKDCRAFSRLIFVQLDTHTMSPGTLELPRYVVIALCPKHFKHAEVKCK